MTNSTSDFCCHRMDSSRAFLAYYELISQMTNPQLASNSPKNAATESQAHLQQFQLPSPFTSPPIPKHLETPISNAQASESVSSQLPSSFQLQEGKRKSKVEGEINEGSADLKRYRTTYSPYQSRVLEEVFQSERYISRPQRNQLANRLHLPENTIKVDLSTLGSLYMSNLCVFPSLAVSDRMVYDLYRLGLVSKSKDEGEAAGHDAA